MPSKSILDAETIEVLSTMDSFFIQQRIRMVEAVTGGCFEQPNVYDVFDHATNKRMMIIKEESDTCSRCCCAPVHSVFVKFYHVGKDAPELKPGQMVDWSYEPSGEPFMTFEREGCDCCFTGPCPKPCLCCFACGEGCSESATLTAGGLTGSPGDQKGRWDRSKLVGETIQPPGGGGFKPLMQLMERCDESDHTGKTELFAATRGPCFTGGCSKLCCSSPFGIGSVAPSAYNKSRELHKANFGDFASITKLRPSALGQAAREIFTDSDLFDVKFTTKQQVTAAEKALVLSQMIHLDYMFFERDQDMCDSDGINIANCFIWGCVCPCKIPYPQK